jgi:hypothetical protein
MNITSILSIIDYDMAKIDLYKEGTIDDNLLNFRFKDVSCHGTFNNLTSEVTYVWCSDADGFPLVYVGKKTEIRFKNLKYKFASDEEILDLLCETFDKEPYVTVPIEMGTEELVLIDSYAAECDLTRNSYLTKCVLNSLKMMEENL